jgi:hypothetical protein
VYAYVEVGYRGISRQIYLYLNHADGQKVSFFTSTTKIFSKFDLPSLTLTNRMLRRMKWMVYVVHQVEVRIAFIQYVLMYGPLISLTNQKWPLYSQTN